MAPRAAEARCRRRHATPRRAAEKTSRQRRAAKRRITDRRREAARARRARLPKGAGAQRHGKHHGRSARPDPPPSEAEQQGRNDPLCARRRSQPRPHTQPRPLARRARSARRSVFWSISIRRRNYNDALGVGSAVSKLVAEFTTAILCGSEPHQ